MATNPVDIINCLENGNYLKQTLNQNEMKIKIEQFSEWFNTICKSYLLGSKETETNDLVFTLTQLIHDINSTIKYLESKSPTKPITYICPICNEQFLASSFKDTWSLLQNHEHFENLYCNFLKSFKTKISELNQEGTVKKDVSQTTILNLAKNFQINLNIQSDNSKPQTSVLLPSNSEKDIKVDSNNPNNNETIRDVMNEIDSNPTQIPKAVLNPRNDSKFIIENDNKSHISALLPSNSSNDLKIDYNNQNNKAMIKNEIKKTENFKEPQQTSEFFVNPRNDFRFNFTIENDNGSNTSVSSSSDSISNVKIDCNNQNNEEAVENEIKEIMDLSLQKSLTNPRNNFKFNFIIENDNESHTSASSPSTSTSDNKDYSNNENNEQAIKIEIEELRHLSPQTSNSFVNSSNNFNLKNNKEVLINKTKPIKQTGNIQQPQTSKSIENPENNHQTDDKDELLIKNLLYPPKYMKAVKEHDKLTFPSLQFRSNNSTVCLICVCSLISLTNRFSKHVLFEHVLGRRHQRSALNEECKSALKQYHTTWKLLNLNYQSHQVFFVPFDTTIMKCLLCNSSVNYNSLQTHIDEGNHKDNLIHCIESEDSKEIHEVLISFQTSVYNDDIKFEHKTANSKKVKFSHAASCDIQTTSEFNGKLENIIPHRFMRHLELFTIENDEIYCKFCEKGFKISPTLLHKHLQTDKHLKLKGFRQEEKFSYLCDICNKKFTEESQWIKHFSVKQNPHELMSETRKVLLKEYECVTCSLVIYGDDISIYRHRSTVARTVPKRKNKKNNILILPNEVKELFKSKKLIKKGGNDLTIEANNVLSDHKRITNCLCQLQLALSELFPETRVYPFGSRIAGLGNMHSDLDIFFDVGDMYLGLYKQDHDSQGHIVKKCAKILKKCKEFSYILPIPNARTPIINVYHRPTDLKCDISFRHGLSVENTKFIKFCISLLPITQPFILMIKHWSYICNIHENVTNYAIALIGIFFLQKEGYLLSVADLRKYNPKRNLLIDGWETITYSLSVKEMKRFVKPCTKDLYQLLTEFFNYFTNFDFANQVICPLLGHQIPKNLFIQPSEGERLPTEMNGYIIKIAGDSNAIFRANTPFCLQDPFDLSHNLTKAWSLVTIKSFIKLCELTYQHLSNVD